MKKWMHKLEVIVDAVIPYCLVLLIIILTLEFGFHNFVVEKNLSTPIELADYFIIVIFVLDLIFKYMRVHNLPQFLRKYWLEIIAVFPFFLFFRLAELAFGLREISGGIQTAQSITHTTAELEREVVAVTKGEKLLREGEMVFREGEKVIKAERSVRFSRFLRPLARIPRFFKTVPQMLHFYDKPTGEHHKLTVVNKR